MPTPPKFETGLIDSALEIASDLKLNKKDNEKDQDETKQNVDKSLAALFAAIPRARLLTIKMQLERDKVTQTPEVSKQYETVIAYLSDRADAKAEKIEERNALATAMEMGRPTETAPPVPETTEGTKVKSPETFFPRTIDVREWSPKQIATVSAVTLGGAGLFALWQWWRHRKDKPAEGSTPKEKQSIWSKLLWIPVIGAGLYGLSKLSKMMEQYGPYKEVIDKLRAEAEEMKKFMKEHVPFSGHGAWEKYGVEKDAYKNAETTYKQKGNKGRAEIATILHMETSDPRLDTFLKEMAEKHDSKELVPGTTVRYVRAAEAVKNYEGEMRMALTEFIHYLKDHEGELIAAGIVATQIESLRNILVRGTLTVAQQAEHIVAFATKSGIRAIRYHPLITFFAVGTTLLAMKEAGEHVWLPENMSQLYRACVESVPLAVSKDGKKILQEGLDSIREHVRSWLMDDGSIGQWVKKQILSLWSLMKNNAPEWLAESAEECIEKKNREGFQALREWLDLGVQKATHDTSERDRNLGTNCLAALQLLEQLETTFIRSRCTTSDEPDTSVELLEKLTSILAQSPPDIRVEVSGGYVNWMSADHDHAFNLCVDPSITDRAEILRLSKAMHQNQTVTTMLFSNMEHALRMKANDALRAGEKVPWLGENKLIAMTIGNFLYVFDWEHQKEYWQVPLNSGVVAWLTGEEDTAQFIANFSNTVVTCTAFSISAGFLAKIKQFAIGGGPLSVNRLERGVRLFAEVMPGTSQVHWGKRLFGVLNTDVPMLQEFGWLRGREYGLVCAKAGIEPHWISIAQTTDDMGVLQNIAHKLGLSEDLIRDPKNIQTEVIKNMEKRLRDVKLHGIGSTATDVSTGRFAHAFSGRTFGGTESLMKEMKYTFADLQQLKKSGMTAKQMVVEEIPARKLLQVWKAEELFNAGVTAEDLIRTGLRSDTLRKLGYTQEAINEGINAVRNNRTTFSAADVVPTQAPPVAPAPTSTPASRTPIATPAAPDLSSAGSSGGSPLKQAAGGKTVPSPISAPRSVPRPVVEVVEKEKILPLRPDNVPPATRMQPAGTGTGMAEAVRGAETTIDDSMAAAAKAARASRWVEKGAIGFAVGVELCFLALNEREIRRANAAGDASRVALLSSKRTSMLGSSTGSVLSMVAPNLPQFLSAGSSALGAGLILSAPIAAAQMYANAVFDALELWDAKMDHRKLLSQDSASLLAGIAEKSDFGNTDWGESAGHGESKVYSGWRALTWSREDNAKRDTALFERVQGTSGAMREAHYMAYFLKNTTLPPDAGTESNAQYATRLNTAAQWKLDYVREATDGRCWSVNPTILDEADAYAELRMIRDHLQHDAKPLQISFSLFARNNQQTTETLDLSHFGINTAIAGHNAFATRDSVLTYLRMKREVERLQFFTLSLPHDARELAEEQQRLHDMIFEGLKHKLYHAQQQIRAQEQVRMRQSIAEAAAVALRDGCETLVRAMMEDATSGTLTAARMQQLHADIDTLLQQATNVDRFASFTDVTDVRERVDRKTIMYADALISAVPSMNPIRTLDNQPEHAVPIELILAQASHIIDTNATSITLKDAKGYTLIPVRRDSQWNVFELNKHNQTIIQTDAVTTISTGSYAIYRPGEGLPQGTAIDTSHIFRFAQQQTEQEHTITAEMTQQRYQEGREYLIRNGGVDHGAALAISVSFGTLDNPLLFSFDKEHQTWQARVSPQSEVFDVMGTGRKEWKDPSTFRVKGTWHDDQYNAVLKDIAHINRSESPKRKAA